MKKKLLVRAALGESVERTPVWMMRQAGRYLPEYHETKRRAGGFLGLCKVPEHGVEVTLQPIRRFGFDAAILFSDILIPAEAMGIELAFDPAPMIGNPVRTLADVTALRVPDPEETMPFVMEIMKGLREALPAETALIGFAGAPFTVASYMVANASDKGQFQTMRRMVYCAPEVVAALLEKLEETTVRYLEAQVAAGAEVVQLFDSSAWQLPPARFRDLALAPARRIISRLRKTGVPIIYFAPGAMTHLGGMRDLGAHVIGVDWRLDLSRAREVLGADIAVQGNLDPACLLGPPETVRTEVSRILAENDGAPGHLFNLGHGVLPGTPIETVEALVEAVRTGG